MNWPCFCLFAVSMENVAWGAFGLDLAAKATLLLAAAFAASVALRRRSAAIRLLLWNSTLTGLLALPILIALLPGWSMPLPMILYGTAGAHLTANAEGTSGMPSMPPVAGEFSRTVGVEGLPAESPLDSPPATADGRPADPLDSMSAGAFHGNLAGNWWPMVAAVWLLGTLGVWAAFFVRWALVSRIVRRAGLLDEDAWKTLAKNLIERLGVRRLVRLAISRETPVPMTWGLLRPVVVLSESIAAGADADQRSAILLHELVHVARCDVFTQWLAALCGGLYWWNPLVWLAVRQRALECEKSCDDRVLVAGARPSQYAALLIEIARAAQHRAWGFSPASTIGKPSLLRRRVTAIVGRNVERMAPGRWAFAVVAAAAAMVAVVATFSAKPSASRAADSAVAESPSEKKPAESSGPPVDLYGDPLPAGALARLGTVRFRSGGTIRGLALTADGTKFVTATAHGELRLWDTASGKPLRTWRLDERPILAVAVSANANIAATLHRVEGDTKPPPVCSLAVWDLTKEKPIVVFRLAHHRNEHRDEALAVSPDGSAVAVGPSDQEACWLSVWSVTRREMIVERRLPIPYGRFKFQFSPDGTSLLAYARDIYLWDWKAGSDLRKLPVSMQFLGSVRIVPDGKTLVVASASGATQFFRLPDCQPIASHPPLLSRFGTSNAPALSPDGKLMALKDLWDPGIDIWETTTRRRLYRFDAYANTRLATAYSSDSKRFADILDNGSTVRIWDMTTGKPVGEEPDGHRAPVATVAFLGRSHLVATAGNDGVRIWDARTGRQQHRMDSAALDAKGTAAWIREMAVSPDGRLIATSSPDRTVRIWDVETGRVLHRLPAAGRDVRPRPVPYTADLIFTADGEQVEFCGVDGVVRRWNVRTGEALTQWPLPRSAVDPANDGAEDPFAAYLPGSNKPKGRWVDGACFSRDGRWLAAFGPTTTVFDAASGKQVAKFLTAYRQVSSAALSPDGKMLLTAGVDRGDPPVPRPGDPGSPPASNLHVRVWNLRSGKVVWVHTLPRNCRPGPVAFSPDGAFFAALTRRDPNEIQTWNAATRQPVFVVKDLSASPVALAFSADNTLLAAGLDDGSALVWQCPPALARR